MNDLSSLRPILFSWERLRILFNIILAIEGLFLSVGLIDFFGGLLHWLLWVLVYAFVANACFSMGPLVELYSIVLRESGFGHARILVFGFLLAIGIAATFLLAASVQIGASADALIEWQLGLHESMDLFP